MTTDAALFLAAFAVVPLVGLAFSCWIARLAGGSWSWAPWGIFGPLGWIAAFALSGAMKAHEAQDRRKDWMRRAKASRSAARRPSARSSAAR